MRAPQDTVTDLSRLKLTPAELKKRHAAFLSKNHLSAAPGGPGAGASPLPNDESAPRRRRAASSCGPRPAERAEPRPRCATACDRQAPRAWRSAGSSSEDNAPRVRRRARACTGLGGGARARCTDSEDSDADEYGGGWARGRRAAAPTRQLDATASVSPGAARAARPDGLRSPGSAHEPAQPGCERADPPAGAQAGCAAVPGLGQLAPEEGAPAQPHSAAASSAAAAPATLEVGLGAGEPRGGGGPGARGSPGAPPAPGPASPAAPAHAAVELDACVRELRARLERAEAAAVAASTAAGLRRELQALQAEQAALQARPA